MSRKLQKRVLITAGPTWVAIDKARVISNIASGETGFILADKFNWLGFKVTLLLGPGYFYSNVKGVKIINFKYFSQLDILLKKELEKNKYDVVIHAAAVADYKPKKTIKNKVGSGRPNWKIDLVPTKKLIDTISRYGDNLFKVGFKFEPSAKFDKLIKKGSALLKKSGLNLVVANSNIEDTYRAYIIDSNNNRGPFSSKEEMAINLAKSIKKELAL